MVAPKDAGAIIGRAGANISSIQTSAGVRVNVSSNPVSQNAERVLCSAHTLVDSFC